MRIKSIYLCIHFLLLARIYHPKRSREREYLRVKSVNAQCENGRCVVCVCTVFVCGCVHVC